MGGPFQEDGKNQAFPAKRCWLFICSQGQRLSDGAGKSKRSIPKKECFSCLFNTLWPVSYTHLDVYKRQLYYNYLPAPVTNVLLVLSVLTYGPCRAGMTYVLRNFACEQHAWISDIWDKAKENWKQGMLFGVLDMLVLFVRSEEHTSELQSQR